MEQEGLENLKEDIASLLHSNGWIYVIRPVMHRRCEEIRKKLAVDKRLDIEGVRELQVKHALLTEIIDDPLRFFGLER